MNIRDGILSGVSLNLNSSTSLSRKQTAEPHRNLL